MILSKEEIKELLDNKLDLFKKSHDKKTNFELLEILNLNDQLKESSNTRRIPLAKWNDYYPYPTVNAMRNMIQNDWNNFTKCIERIGKKIFINEAKYKLWQEQQAK